MEGDNFMGNNDDDNDPITTALQSRRIPHGRSAKSKGKGKKNGGNGRSGGRTTTTSVFNPLRALGLYELIIGSGSGSGSAMTSKGQKGHESSSSSQIQSQSQSFLTIHSLTRNEDGFIASIDLFNSDFVGMGILAGSRKGLRMILDDLERSSESASEGGEAEEEDDDDDGDNNKNGEEEKTKRKPEEEKNEDEEDNDDDKSLESHHKHTSRSTSTEAEQAEAEAEQAEQPPQSAMEAEDERINRRVRAFEKNTFRNPKFWLAWRMKPNNREKSSHDSNSATSSSNTNNNKNHDHQDDMDIENKNDRGYLIFSGNDCARFDGTLSCDRLGWDNVKVKGYKVKSQVRGICPLDWSDF